MHDQETINRRSFLCHGLAMGTGLILGTYSCGAAQTTQPPCPIPVGPIEDLMREHGVTQRIMLIYDRVLCKYGENQPLPTEELKASARIAQKFIGDYHEQLEEPYIFPKFEKTDQMIELINILREQHRLGRQLSGRIIDLSSATAFKNERSRRNTREALRAFNTMYRPHIAREDTVLYPTLHSLITPEEFNELGETFKQKETELFGKDGFQNLISQGEKLEKIIGTYDLKAVMPK